ncbi:MAG: zinc ribbon domain-containing protein [Armatimonadota bacterium]|nr:zinc ribbon domain-containing protein [Armatimonadota bacterium]
MQASTPETRPETFAPLPLRPRGTLEILDTSVKVYRRYFWILIGWSTITNALVAVQVVPFLVALGWLSFFLTPLMTGATACCIAAAVRGQTVRFGTCWQFTQPRYWSMLALNLLASGVAGAVLFVVAMLCFLLVLAGVFLFQNAGQTIQITMAVVAGLVLGTVVTVIALVAFIWMSLVPIVVAMEEDKHNLQALSRAYQLMSGQWMRLTGLMTILGLASLALGGILAASALLLLGIPALRNLLTAQPTDPSIWLALAGFAGSITVLSIITSPILNLIITLFYLDMRVRKEALDLEWAAHVTAPVATPVTTAATGRPVVELPPAEAFTGTRPLEATGLAATASLTSSVSPAATRQLTDNPVASPPVADNAADANTIVCPQCGAPAAATHTFCMKCGARLSSA